MIRRANEPGPDPEYDDDDKAHGYDIGCITQLSDKPMRVKRAPGPHVRIGFHPPSRAYEDI